MSPRLSGGFSPFPFTHHVGDLRDAPALCRPERSARERARESKDPGAALGDHAASGSSTETFFLLFPNHPITRGFPSLDLFVALCLRFSARPCSSTPRRLQWW